MDASLVARLREFEEENRRFKKMYAEERLKAEIIQMRPANSPAPMPKPLQYPASSA